MTRPLPLVVRAADLEAADIGSRDLRRASERGLMTRVVPGSYIRTSTWVTLSARDRYITRVHAVASRLTGPIAISHWSAAAIWGLPIPDTWPRAVQITDPRRQSSTTRSSLHRRPGTVTHGDVIAWEGSWITTASRTAADIALTSPFDEAVVVFDQGLRLELFTKEQVATHLARRPNARRSRSALAALEFATAAAQWPGESFSRVGMATRGIATPVLQKPYFDARGKIGDADFSWEQARRIEEFDGQWKYTDPRFMLGRTAAEVIRDEKRRHARLEAHPDIDVVVRWDYAVARDPDELARRLLAAGVPRADRHAPRRPA